MATRIFLSNKDDWGNDIESAINEAKEAFAALESYVGSWTCGNVKSIQLGERAYFKRVGSEPRGFFARGRIVALEDGWIDFEWDSVVDYGKPLEINWLKNQPEFSGAFFDFRGSGSSFKEEYVEFLDKYWEAHVLRMSRLGHGASSGEFRFPKPIGTSFWIQYHNYEQMGGLPGGLPGYENELGISTNKKSVLNAEGDTVFLIVGIGEPRRYYFWSRFVVEGIEQVVDEEGKITYNAFGNGWLLNPPQLLNSEKFSEFQRFCGNFGLGFTKIDNSSYLEILKHLSKTYEPQSSNNRSRIGTEKFYTYVLSINPRDTYAYYCRGLIRDQLENTQAAIEDYSEAIRIESDFADAYNHRGLAHFSLGNLDKAIEDFSQAMSLAPDFADAYHNRGFIRSIQGDKQGAIEDYNQAIQLNPDDAEAYVNRGIAHSDLENYQEAIQDYNQALNINPNDAAAYYNRGIAHKGLEDKQSEIENYTKALEIDPEFADAYHDRGIARSEIGDIQEAVEDLQKAAALYHQNEMTDDYQNVMEFIQALVAAPEEELTAAQELADTDGTFNPVNIQDARKRVERSIVLRRGQSEFRRSLLDVYKGRCAISDCDAKQALSAAHIIPYRGDNTNHLSNGLLLRADIHILFDLHLIAVDPETMEVLVAPSLRSTYYGKFDRRKLPEAAAALLSREALHMHRNQCEW